jgi:hypothetical protein
VPKNGGHTGYRVSIKKEVICIRRRRREHLREECVASYNYVNIFHGITSSSVAVLNFASRSVPTRRMPDAHTAQAWNSSSASASAPVLSNVHFRLINRKFTDVIKSLPTHSFKISMVTLHYWPSSHPGHFPPNEIKKKKTKKKTTQLKKIKFKTGNASTPAQHS